MIYSGVPSFFGLGLKDAHGPTFGPEVSDGSGEGPPVRLLASRETLRELPGDNWA